MEGINYVLFFLSTVQASEVCSFEQAKFNEARGHFYNITHDNEGRPYPVGSIVIGISRARNILNDTSLAYSSCLLKAFVPKEDTQNAEGNNIQQ